VTPDSASPPEPQVVTFKRALVLLAFVFGLFFMLEDLLGLINGGGLFSVVGALQAASRRVPTIDVDSAGLRTLFITICAAFALLALVRLKTDLTNNAAQFVAIMFVVGGGFVLDAIYGERLIGNALAAHGYSHCAGGDFDVGHGKSRVWFDHYVLDPAACRPARSESGSSGAG